MTSFNPLSLAFDAWRVTRCGSQLLANRQQNRLSELAMFARTHSRFYTEKYRGLPETITDVRQLPPVTKTELMERFDEVVTDPVVRKANVGAFMTVL
jgi:phenylacetate-CoA ligase